MILPAAAALAALVWVAPAVEPAPVPEPWHSLAACESDHTWDYDGLHHGGLQFWPATWDAFRPDGFPDHAYDATPSQQVVVAERVLDVQGWKAWPVCSRKLGLR